MDTKALRQKILDLAIRGKLVPQDPNDEPASVLLGRIRAEKQQMVKDGKLKAKDIKNDTIIFKGEDNLHYEKLADSSIKCIEDEIPFEIPEGWAWTRLSQIGDTNIGLTYSPSNIVKTGVPVLRSSNIIDGKMNYSDLVCVDADIRDNQVIQLGDILICARNGSKSLVGKCAIYDGKFPFASFGAFMAVFRTKYYSFIYYYLLTDVFRATFTNDDSKQINQLTQEKIKCTLLPLPPYCEQKRICAKIHELLELVESVEQDKRLFLTCIRATKSRILDLAIRGKLVPQDPNDEPASVLLERIRAEKEELIKQGKIKRDKKESVIFRGEDNSYYEKVGNTVGCIDEEIPFDIPKGWEVVRFSTLWGLLSGRDLQSGEYNDEHSGIPYITGASNFDDGRILINRWTTKPQVVSEIGDLLLTCKGTVGEMSVNDFGKAHIARQVMAIRNTYRLNAEFLRLTITFYIDRIKRAAKGLIPGISREDILNLLLPVPAEDYQQRVVESVQYYDTVLFEIEESLT